MCLLIKFIFLLLINGYGSVEILSDKIAFYFPTFSNTPSKAFFELMLDELKFITSKLSFQFLQCSMALSKGRAVRAQPINSKLKLQFLEFHN